MKNGLFLALIASISLIQAHNLFADESTTLPPAPKPAPGFKLTRPLVSPKDRQIPRALVRKDLNIFLNACGYPGINAENQRACFRALDDVIKGENIMVALNHGCSNISSDQMKSTCFENSTKLIQNDKLSNDTANCSAIKNDDKAKAECFGKNFENWPDQSKRPLAYVIGLKMINIACHSMSFSDSVAHCIREGLRTLVNRPNLYDVLSTMCEPDPDPMHNNVKISDNDRTICYTTGIYEVQKDRKTPLTEISDKCSEIESTADAASCFKTELNNLMGITFGKQSEQPLFVIKEVNHKSTSQRRL